MDAIAQARAELQKLIDTEPPYGQDVLAWVSRAALFSHWTRVLLEAEAK